MTDEPKQTKPDLAARLGDALMAALDFDETVAVRHLLEAGATRDFFRTLADFADLVANQVGKMKAGDKSDAPEPQRLPGADDDSALRSWLAAEKEIANGPH
jgi:hypothetical protein